jgi:hypothetical protein
MPAVVPSSGVSSPKEKRNAPAKKGAQTAYQLPMKNRGALLMTELLRDVHCVRISAGSRTYFFDIKKSSNGARFLVIHEARYGKADALQPSILVFEEHLREFLRGLDKALQETGIRVRVGTHSLAETRRKFPRAYEKWTGEEDANLKDAFRQCKETQTLADTFQRQPGAIRSRLVKLRLIEP